MFADALEIIIIMLGVAVLTALICWLIWRNRYRNLEALYLQKGKAYDELKELSDKQSTKIDQLTRDLEACSMARIEFDLQLQKRNEAYDVLEGQLRILNKQLEKEKERFDSANAQAIRLGTFKAKFDQVEPVLKEIVTEYAQQKASVNSLPDSKTEAPVSTRGMAPAEPASVSAAEEELILSRIRTNAARLNFDRMGTATATEKDDLKIIKGIGPFIEKKLNALDIFTFRQIASFSEEDEDLVNEAIEFFPGRVRRDKWVPQARGLMDGGTKAIEEATALKRVSARAQEINFDRIGVATEEEKDDLKIVKGIGPFIEKKLNSIGIFTFRQIANFTPEDEDKVNEVIEFFSGRIRRDQWSSQAKKLAEEKIRQS